MVAIALLILLRGHIQTICEKINVIMTLTPAPPPPPLSVIQNNLKVDRLQSFNLFRDSTPTTQSHFFYSSVVSTYDIARSANSK